MTALPALSRAHQPPDEGPGGFLSCLGISDWATDVSAAVAALGCEMRKGFPAREHL